MAAEAITVNVKLISGSSFSVDVAADIKIEDLRTKLAEQSEIPSSQQRLVYSGRILKDGQTLSSYGFKSNHALHLVKAATTQPTPQTTSQAPTTPRQPSSQSAFQPQTSPSQPSPLGNPAAGLMGSPMTQQLLSNPDMMAGLLDSPMMQSMLSNPDTVRAMMMANPQTRRMMESYPEMAQMMSDPDILRQSLEMARNPALRAEMMRQQDRAFSNIEAMPGGFQHLSRMHQDMVEPMMEAASAGNSAPQPDLSDNPFASLLQSPSSSAPTPQRNTEALPNPWAAPQPSSSGSAPGMAGNPFASLPNPGAAPEQPDEDLYGTGSSSSSGSTAPPAGGMPGMNLFGGPGPAGLSNPAMLQMAEAMLDSPMMAEQLRAMASNPETLRSMLDSNPATANNPMLRAQMEAVMSQPGQLQRFLNPENVRTALRMQRMMANPSALSAEETAQLQQDMARLATGQGATPAASTGTSSSGPTPAGSSNASGEQYRLQLDQLADMGFTDREANLQALRATNGNVHMAVQRLLG
eukprot:TRINITY_DN12142_c0_g2_i26.p1 TRINITY_DN12142_c0_g2~~TRINITY_DN12142_c0_g2_i26.p1  ORF type:complete len:522 (+),score=127.01 TRINITY_DN12142_c0_g2_i26:138-1703(+)